MLYEGFQTYTGYPGVCQQQILFHALISKLHFLRLRPQATKKNSCYMYYKFTVALLSFQKNLMDSIALGAAAPLLGNSTNHIFFKCY